MKNPEMARWCLSRLFTAGLVTALMFTLLLNPIPGFAEKLLDIRDLRTKVTARDEVVVQVSWQLELANKAGRPILVAAEIEFLDTEGFILTFDYEGRLLLETGEVKTFTGIHRIRTEMFSKVATVHVKARVRP
jgi:hypothetical protein